jgi:PIN domain nuclease of toxin-antitoxin system
MRILLDTHTFLWFITGDPKLSGAARKAIENVAHEKHISVITAWEIAIKWSLGKLTLARPFDVLIPQQIQQNGFLWLPLELTHLIVLAALPFHHRDPFDRSLVAQALKEGMPLVSVDPALDGYGIVRIW